MIDIWSWIKDFAFGRSRSDMTYKALHEAAGRGELDAVYDALPDQDKNDLLIIAHMPILKARNALGSAPTANPVQTMLGFALDEWIEHVEKMQAASPGEARAKLISELAFMLDLVGKVHFAQRILQKIPWANSPALDSQIRKMFVWLGFGAVATAISHDPVKIGLLRPWQDNLEATFRNRRPDDYALFQAYRTRELSPEKIEDLSKLNDAEMDRIEKDNQAWYDKEIAKWGYSEWFSNALARSATRTLNFTQLNTLARQGLLDRGLAIYSLWGEGLDRVVMAPALDALMAQNEMASYEGFRSLVEPSFVEGTLDEPDLITYWDKIRVPKDIQDWVLPRLKKRREKYLAKEKAALAGKERDLTVSQLLSLYREEKRGRTEIFNRITAMGYSKGEADELLILAEPSIKVTKPATLKRLPLSDYEKAYKNKLLPLEAVLERMKGEYDLRDMNLEKDLLEKGVA